jgi:hypothetical protein
MKKQSLFVFILLLIIGGLVYLLVTDAELPSTADIGELTEHVLENDTDKTEEDVAVTEVEDVTDEEEVVDETDESDDEEVVDDEPIDEFDPVEVTDDYLGTTFENAVYGYSVDFPENWYWEHVGPDQITSYIDYLWIDPAGGIKQTSYGGMVHVGVQNTTLAEKLAKSDEQNESYTLYEVSVDGKNATRVEFDNDSGFYESDVSIYVYIERDGILYEIGMFPDGHDEELFQRVLNSFKFID